MIVRKNLVKFPVAVILDPGGIASLPQQRGEWGSGIFGKTLELVNPSFTPVSSSPETWHFTLYRPLPVYLAKYLRVAIDY